MERAAAREVAAGHEPKIIVASADASPQQLGNYFGYGYDAARYSTARSSLVFPLTARREFNARDRKAILEKLRSLEANLGLIPRMKSQVGKYAVGHGIFPVPQTSDTEWNALAVQLFDDWANNRFVCDAAGAMTFWERQRFHAETFFSEGESFDVMISSSQAGAPQLQLFDTAEVGGGYGTPATPGFVDGVRVNAQNRPLEYEVVIAGANGQLATQVVSALDMIHLVKRKRANQLRAISPFAPAINPAIDVMDLDAVITQSAKLHNAMGITVGKKSGEAGKTGITGQVKKILGDDTKVTEVREDFIRGALIQYLGLNEEMKIVTSDRPTQNLLDFLVYRIRNICLTTGLPFEIVWNLADLGGANSRIILADAQWFFDGIQDSLNEMLNQRVWVWRIASAMKNGELRACLDPRWWNNHWQGPPKLTADAGRAIQGDVLALQNGMLNWEDYHNARGANYRDKIGKQIAALAWAKSECDKVGVPFEYIFSLKPGTPVSGDSNVGGAVA
jgi:capsid protein